MGGVCGRPAALTEPLLTSAYWSSSHVIKCCMNRGGRP